MKWCIVKYTLMCLYFFVQTYMYFIALLKIANQHTDMQIRQCYECWWGRYMHAYEEMLAGYAGPDAADSYASLFEYKLCKLYWLFNRIMSLCCIAYKTIEDVLGILKEQFLTNIFRCISEWINKNVLMISDVKRSLRGCLR